jgi:hypothetical protein
MSENAPGEIAGGPQNPIHVSTQAAVVGWIRMCIAEGYDKCGNGIYGRIGNIVRNPERKPNEVE